MLPIYCYQGVLLAAVHCDEKNFCCRSRSQNSSVSLPTSTRAFSDKLCSLANLIRSFADQNLIMSAKKYSVKEPVMQNSVQKQQSSPSNDFDAWLKTVGKKFASLNDDNKNRSVFTNLYPYPSRHNRLFNYRHYLQRGSAETEQIYIYYKI